MNDQELIRLSQETREKLLIALGNEEEKSTRHEIIDNVIWALEDLEQFLSSK